jgi:hypothetical protein
MIQRDSETYPGGVMTGFVLWSQENLRNWKAANAERASVRLTGVPEAMSEAEFAEYDAWLAAQFPPPADKMDDLSSPGR